MTDSTMIEMPLVERLLKVESAKPEWHEGPVTCWYRNPDGPEAAAALKTKTVEFVRWHA